MAVPRGSTASALLHCLEQLNDEVWETLLLPKLQADKSAGAVALTCSRLRQLCQSNQGKLNLTSLGNNSTSTSTSAVRAWTAPLPQHFPNCCYVSLRLEANSSYLVMPCVAEALARLPKLTKVTMAVEGCLQPLALAMVLSSMTDQLPQLCNLALQSHQPWSASQLIWEQLGKATQLTCLSIVFQASVLYGCGLQNVTALHSLTGLQALVCNAGKRQQQQQQQQEQQLDMAFLANLTALTQLDLPVWTAEGLSSISSCCALKVLRLRSTGRMVDPSAEDWAAIGTLTQLTRLYVSRSLQGQDQQPFYAALQNLTGLVWATAGHWTPAVLPAFATMPALSYVKGAWREAGDGLQLAAVVAIENATCPEVKWLEGAAGPVPFRAFPNLQGLKPAGAIDAASWVDLGSYCTKLQYMSAPMDVLKPPDWPSLPRGTVAGERVTAIKALSQLTELTSLSFNTSHQIELGALVDAVPQVQRLQVMPHIAGDADWMCLVPLGKVTALTRLAIGLWDLGFHSMRNAAALLAAISHVPDVLLAVEGTEFTYVQLAVEERRSLGLKLPDKLKIEELPEHDVGPIIVV